MALLRLCGERLDAFRLASKAGLLALALLGTASAKAEAATLQVGNVAHTQQGATKPPSPEGKVFPAQAGKEQSVPETNKQNDGPRVTDWIAAIAAVVSAFFTVALAISTHRLWVQTKRLAGGGEDQHDTLKKSVEIAERQMLIAGAQTDIISKQHQIGRLAFLSEHRPRIILRDVSMINDARRQIIYSLVNIGGSDATLVESWFIFELISPRMAVRNMRSAGHDELGPVQFAAGEVKDFILGSDGANGTALAFAAYGMGAGTAHHFAGAILYEDSDGRRRRSVFRRALNPATNGFTRLDDTDQEYAD